MRVAWKAALFSDISKLLHSRTMTVHAYLRLIVLKNIPVSIVEDVEIRKFSQHKEHISVKTIIQVISQLVELIQKRITVDLQGTRGVLLDQINILCVCVC